MLAACSAHKLRSADWNFARHRWHSRANPENPVRLPVSHREAKHGEVAPKLLRDKATETATLEPRPRLALEEELRAEAHEPHASSRQQPRRHRARTPARPQESPPYGAH